MDTDSQGRWFVEYNKQTKRWDVKLNGTLRAEAQTEHSAKDYVATQVHV